MSRRAPTARGSGRRPRHAERLDLVLALGLTLLAWAHRLAFLLSNRDRDWPFTIFYEGDSETFFRGARALLAGELWDNGIPFHPPGFAWLLAGVHALLGAGAPDAEVPFFAVKATLALGGSASVGLLFALARPYLGRLPALVGALLCAWSFGLEVLHVAPVGDGLYQTLLLLALVLFSRRFEHPLAAPVARGGPRVPAPALAVLFGALLGLLALVRAEGLAVGALLVGFGAAAAIVASLRRAPDAALGPQRSLARALVPWALAALGALLAVAPWTLRNAVRLGEFNARVGVAEPLPTFVPITLYGPLNLALANNPRATGTFSRAVLESAATSPVLDLRDPEHLRLVLHGDAIAWAWIRENPKTFATLVARRWALSAGAWRLGFTQWNWPGGLAGIRAPVDVFVPDSRAALWFVAPLALLGLALGLQGGLARRFIALAALPALVTLAASGLFFGYVRLILIVLPFGFALAGAGVVALGRLAPRLFGAGRGVPSDRPLASLLPAPEEPIPPRALRVVGAVATLLLLVELWGATGDRNYQATGTNVAGAGYLNRDDPVRLEVLSGPGR